MRRGPYKLVKESSDLELFDLKADIGETGNIAADKPEIVTKLQKLHDAWNAELIEPLWGSPGQGAKKIKQAKETE